MSTRSTTWFTDGDRAVAKVYRHADGYPEGHGVDLQRFFTDVEMQTQDTRFNDPSYLAAKLVVWLAREFATSYEPRNASGTRPLDFLSVGVIIDDPGDIKYVYVIDCSRSDENGRPVVTCHEATRNGSVDGWKISLGDVVPVPTPEAVV